jgi:hypothetical protein
MSLGRIYHGGNYIGYLLSPTWQAIGDIFYIIYIDTLARLFLAYMAYSHGIVAVRSIVLVVA